MEEPQRTDDSTTSSADESLAGPEFWEDDYLRDVALPSTPDPGFSFDAALAEALAALAPAQKGDVVLEVGCAPAKWLAFYAQRFGARPVGIEYTPHGAALSRRNLELLGIDGEIVEADFFTTEVRPARLVLSLGFIEHFPDPEAVILRHLEFVEPGGLVVIGVPNYQGLLGRLQRWADPEHLALHNTAAMDPALYRRVAARSGATVEAQRFLDGPDPAIIRLGRASATPPVYALGVLRRASVVGRVNHRYLSAYLLTVLRRPSG